METKYLYEKQGEEDMKIIDKLSIQQIECLKTLLTIIIAILLPNILEYYVKYDNWIMAILITLLTFISIYSSFSWLQSKMEFRKLYRNSLIRDYHHPQLIVIKWISKHIIENEKGDTLTQQIWIVKSEDKPIDMFPYFINSPKGEEPKIIDTKGCSLIRNVKRDSKYKGGTIFAYDLRFIQPINKKKTEIKLEFKVLEVNPVNEGNTAEIQITHRTMYSEYEVVLPEKSKLLYSSLKNQLENTLKGCKITKQGFICKIKRPEPLVSYKVNYQWLSTKK